MIALLLHLLKFFPVSLDPRSLWDNAAILKRRERLNRLVGILNDPNEFSNNLNAFELTILSTPAHEIVARIGSRRLNWNAKNVLKAFIKAAIHAHVETNCLTEIMFEEALERADQLDKEFAATGRLRGRLHGIPVSLKDQINVEGFDSTIGFTKFVNQPAGENAPVVDRLIEEGAIPFTKTNVPQSLFSFECSNPIFGPTHNPYKRGFTCGGSSGGEAALLASDGSCLGIGSDIGGSLRIPAHYCGCYSLKPCSGRIVQDGTRRANDGYTEILGVIGPISYDVSQIWIDSTGRFRYEIFAPLVAEDTPPSLKFGFFTSNNLIETSSPCRRAVLETVEVLRLAGYDCVEIDVTRLDILEGLVIYVGLSSADGYQTMLSHVGSDHIDWSMFLTTIGCKLPNWFRWTLSRALKYLVRNEMMAKLVEASRAKSTGELQQWRVRRDAYCLKVRSYLWEELELDGLICPTQAVPAIPMGSSWNKSFIAESTLIWNLVDSTVGQLPITRVNVQKDQFQSATESMTRGSRRQVEMTQVTKLLPTIEESEGLPVGIQLVCGLWEEEKTLALMGVIERSWNNRPNQNAPLSRPGDFIAEKQRLGIANSRH
ncbi:uncharacterized protein PGTG_15056 [Puccinia graminis f. sp. tritici CRL 75-36-700-3]|uniref:amidase n=1 Tax=Puccinia graminis f. sp. tritici (strain CRL 75-36-700-3 / race SCCL) TaxID=418459 RepID=E3KY14_PUCGT|nr:uncharacterized protein PGTG_15056 [Puccinia graminis f. sp. tritici CRL 75-36-700-3]EFP89215.2 hypothetical protein PGTG_15056 [Puccinia graminis f. sp. tritici CRL 75-36-700-3]